MAETGEMAGQTVPIIEVRGTEAGNVLIRSLYSSQGIRGPWKVRGNLTWEGGILSNTSLGKGERRKESKGCR